MSESLLPLFNMSDHERIALYNHSVKKGKFIFFMFFDNFSLLIPFLCLRAKRSCYSLLSCSFLKSDGSNSLLSLFIKVGLRANPSHFSLQKSDHEGFIPLANDKRVTGAICSFYERFALSLTKNKQFAQKTDEQP